MWQKALQLSGGGGQFEYTQCKLGSFTTTGNKISITLGFKPKFLVLFWNNFICAWYDSSRSETQYYIVYKNTIDFETANKYTFGVGTNGDWVLNINGTDFTWLDKTPNRGLTYAAFA